MDNDGEKKRPTYYKLEETISGRTNKIKIRSPENKE